MHEDHALNRASWDILAEAHGQDAYYDSEALVAGASSLIEEEESALESATGPNLAGLRILHMQCHLGFDAITFARRGARVISARRGTCPPRRIRSSRCRAGS